jgi:hypothetical protein
MPEEPISFASIILISNVMLSDSVGLWIHPLDQTVDKRWATVAGVLESSVSVADGSHREPEKA